MPIISTVTTTFRSISTSTGAKPFDSIPGPKSLPLINNVWRYLPIIGQYKPDTLVENARYNREKYGPIVREKITSNLTVLHLFRPSDIESLFRQDGKHPHRRSHRALLKYRRERPNLYRDGGLFPENGENWFRQRMQFQTRMLSKTEVSANTEKLDQVSLKTLDRIDRRLQGVSSSIHIADFQNILYEWALGNSLTLFLDLDIYQLEPKIVKELIEELHNSLDSTDKTEIQTSKWINRPNKCPYYKMLTGSQDYLHDFVARRVSDASQSSAPETSYLQNWINIDKIDRKDIISFIVDLLMAGMHTTSYTTAFLLKNIAKHDNIFKTLRSEINRHLMQEGHIAGEQIDKLGTLRNCLRETLRLNPVSIGTGRLVDQENIEIASFKIPKGTQIITQNQVISRDPEIYHQPDSFDPDRWTRYRQLPRDQRPSSFATLPFGFGTRSCLGQRLSELQIKVFVARLIQKFNFQMSEHIPTKTTLIHNLNGNIGIDLTKV